MKAKKVVSLLMSVLMMGAIILCGCEPAPPIEPKPPTEYSDCGEIYEMNEVYGYGSITYEDVKSIAYHHGDQEYKDNLYYFDDFTPKAKGELSEEIAEKIKQATVNQERKVYKDIDTKDIKITEFYGCYNGCYAFMYERDKKYEKEDVAQEFVQEFYLINFHYESEYRIKVWREKAYDISVGTFYELSDGYKAGEITRNDLLSVAYYFHERTSAFNEEEMGEDFVPQPMTPLGGLTKNRMCRDFLIDYRTRCKIRDEDDITIEIYLGCYNGWHIFGYTATFIAYDTVAEPKIWRIDGITFWTRSRGLVIGMWKEA